MTVQINVGQSQQWEVWPQACVPHTRWLSLVFNLHKVTRIASSPEMRLYSTDGLPPAVCCFSLTGFLVPLLFIVAHLSIQLTFDCDWLLHSLTSTQFPFLNTLMTATYWWLGSSKPQFQRDEHNFCWLQDSFGTFLMVFLSFSFFLPSFAIIVLPACAIVGIIIASVFEKVQRMLKKLL